MCFASCSGSTEAVWTLPLVRSSGVKESRLQGNQCWSHPKAPEPVQIWTLYHVHRSIVCFWIFRVLSLISLIFAKSMPSYNNTSEWFFFLKNMQAKSELYLKAHQWKRTLRFPWWQQPMSCCPWSLCHCTIFDQWFSRLGRSLGPVDLSLTSWVLTLYFKQWTSTFEVDYACQVLLHGYC